MGQKVHPYGFRLGYSKPWKALWFDEKNYPKMILADYKVRKYLKDNFKHAKIIDIFTNITPHTDTMNVTIHSARPGIIIGVKGSQSKAIRNDLEKITGFKISLSIRDFKNPDVSAQFCAENIAEQIEKRTSFRRAMKKTMQKAMKAGAKGIKVAVSGRLNGAEIARTEWYRLGRLPLSTLKADVDYGFYEAHTTAGIIGIKVWIYTHMITKQDTDNLFAHNK